MRLMVLYLEERGAALFFYVSGIASLILYLMILHGAMLLSQSRDRNVGHLNLHQFDLG